MLKNIGIRILFTFGSCINSLHLTVASWKDLPRPLLAYFDSDYSINLQAFYSIHFVCAANA